MSDGTTPTRAPDDSSEDLTHGLPGGDEPELRFLLRWRGRAERTADRYQAMAVEQPLFGLPLAFIARYTARQGMLLASATAFRLFLWLMPLALLSAGILAGISNGDPDSVDLAARATGITATTRQQVVDALQQGERSWWIAVIIGAVTFLWTTRTLMRSLRVVNSHVWGAPLPRARQKDLLITTLFFAGAWIVVFLAATFIGLLDDVIPGGWILVGVFQSLLFGGAWLAFTLRLPDRRVDWIDLLPGAVMFGVCATALHVISRLYLPAKFAHSSQLYGSLGVAATILAWLLLIGQVIVSAGLANAIWSEFRASRAAISASPATPTH